MLTKNYDDKTIIEIFNIDEQLLLKIKKDIN